MPINVNVLVRIVVCALLTEGIILASGGKTPTPPPPAPNSAEIRISNELVPAGGTAQIKFALTNPQPILSGGSSFGMQPDGVSLWSPAGDAAGVAVYKDGQLYISAISPAADLGMSEYPFLTVTAEVPSTLQKGAVIPLNLQATSLLTGAGALNITVKPGILIVGGSFSIHNVTPGGGTYPAGTTIRVVGKGFVPNAQLRAPQMKFSSYKVVSSTEIDFTLQEQTTLDGQPIQVTVGAITQTYYSYLRGVPLSEPSRSLLKNTDPIFQQQTHALAQAGPFPAQDSGQYVAFALQNPNAGPAVATLNLTHSDGTVSTSMIVLLSGVRIMDDVAAMVNVSSLQPGDQFSLATTAPIQIVGLTVDENAGTVIPFLPSF